MKQIKLSDTHYIVVDKTQEIKEGDWCIMLDSFGNLFSGCQQYLGESVGHYLNKGHIKITHSTQPIKGVGYYPLSLAKEIAGEVDVEKKDKKYTEEDMRKAMSQAFFAAQENYNITSDEIIQSLQPPTEWEVEIVEGKLKRK